MFTGIIEELGRVKNMVSSGNSLKLSIECRDIMTDLKIGDSVAVDGICLTVITLGDDGFTVDVMPETVRKSAMNSLKPNQKVNLERALKVSDRFGGHIVCGHIDGIGSIYSKKVEDNAVWLRLKAPATILQYFVPQGSVALNGVSLTVASISSSGFEVSLIPITRQITNLNLKKEGDEVNIECDIIGKYVHTLINGMPDNTEKNRLTIGFLKENGYLE
jgi:riboflavin synthase